MGDAMEKTQKFPPDAVLERVWAATGVFSKVPSSGPYKVLSDTELSNLETGLKDKHLAYVRAVVPAMDACLRSMHTIFEWRELNFKERDALRDAALESVGEDMKSGLGVGDYLKTIPTFTAVSAAGTAYNYFQEVPAKESWFFGLSLGVIGLIVHAYILKKLRERRMWLFVRADYDRALYFDDYLHKVRMALELVYDRANGIHERIFGGKYSNDPAEDYYKPILKAIKRSDCYLVHIHMGNGTITPDQWPICKSGLKDRIEECPYYYPDGRWSADYEMGRLSKWWHRRLYGMSEKPTPDKVRGADQVEPPVEPFA